MNSTENSSRTQPTPPDRPCSNDRFELLSAYMDGEVTAEERRLVESWLATEPKVQQMHQRLMMLKHGLHDLPGPAPEQPVEVVIDQVFERVDRRSRFRLIAGGLATAAAAGVAVVVGINTIGPNVAPQMAKNSKEIDLERITPMPEENMTAGLLVSLDQPVFSTSSAKTATGGVKTANTDNSPWEQN